MVDRRGFTAFGVAALMTSVSPGVKAGMPVFDYAAFVQAIAAFQDAAKQIAALQAQLQTQRDQLINMRKQLQSMNPSQIAGILGDITGLEELHKLEKTLAANRDLLESMNNVKKGFEARLDTAKLMKLTWKEYVAWEQKRIERKETSAIARVEAEVHAMKRIESDYKFAREQGGKIAATAGTHEAMQLMNVQMNRVVQQNAELMRQLSTAFGRATAEREMQEAEDKARQKAQEDALRERVEAIRAADRAAVQAWKDGRKP